MSVTSNESSRIDNRREDDDGRDFLRYLMEGIYGEKFPWVDGILRTGSALLDVNDVFQESGYAPIHAACEVGNLKILRLLVDHGADETKRTARTGATPLCVEIACNQ